MNRFTDNLKRMQSDAHDWWISGVGIKAVVGVLLALLLIVLVLAILWSGEPEAFDVNELSLIHI